MKKILTVLFTVMTAVAASAQGSPGMDMEIKQFQDKKVDSGREYYGDIPARITKVVVSGDNSMTDLLFRNSVEESWNISPYEFCDPEEFDRIKTDTNYYFLVRLDKMHRKADSPAMEFVCFLKGNEKAGDNLSQMPELIALPLFPDNDDNDRIFTYLPAYMNIIQTYIQKIVDGKVYPSKRGEIHLGTMSKSRNTAILFNSADMAYHAPMQKFEQMFRGRANTVSQEEIDLAMKNAAPRTLVSLVVAPGSEEKGAWCYKMIISADTYELYYFKKHKISPKKGPGFLKSDLKRISKLVTPHYSAQ